ncbi:MAG: riboflavin biosynthesis protein RibF, partial [Bacillus sp. (in: firmicutes)]
VMTFDPHPSVVLGKSDQRVSYLTPLDDKIQLIEQLGIDYLFIVHFTPEFANLLPQEFIDQYIIALNVGHVIAGFDYAYGRMGKGNMETIPFHSRGQFESSVVPKFALGDEKVSTTLIRAELQSGSVDRLPALLGRFFSTTGIVEHGEKRGRTIGFPTANIDVSEDYLLPPTGVYAVRIKIGQEWFDGVCNRGFKPTFHQKLQKQTIEVHIFDFAGDIYEQIVTVEWHLRLRNEQKFSGFEELVTQIEKDKQNALSYFMHNSI